MHGAVSVGSYSGGADVTGSSGGDIVASRLQPTVPVCSDLQYAQAQAIQQMQTLYVNVDVNQNRK